MSDRDERNFVSIRHDRIKCLGEGDATRKTDGYRIEAKEGYGALGRWDHHVRASETPNAEPNMLGHNRVWCAETKWQGLYCDRRDPRLQRILKRDYLACLTMVQLVEKKVGLTSKGKQGKLRTDTVYLEELLIWASPAWFRNGDLKGPIDEQRREPFERLVVQWLREKFGENLLVVVSHGDESNPHINAFVLPLVRKLIKAKGRLKIGEQRKQWHGYVLNASAYFSADLHFGKTVLPGLCSRNQSELAAFLKKQGLDLERGIEQSQLNHRRMRAHAQTIHFPMPRLPMLALPEPDPLWETKKQYRERIYDAVQSQLEEFNNDVITLFQKANAYQRANEFMRGYQITARNERKLRNQLSAEIAKLQEELVKQKKLSANLHKEVQSLKTTPAAPRHLPTLEQVSVDSTLSDFRRAITAYAGVVSEILDEDFDRNKNDVIECLELSIFMPSPSDLRVIGDLSPKWRTWAIRFSFRMLKEHWGAVRGMAFELHENHRGYMTANPLALSQREWLGRL